MTTTETKLAPPPRTVPARYDNGAIALHWLIAAAVLLNIGLGLYMGDIPRGDPLKFAIVNLHKSVGLTVLVLSVLRVVWRLMHPVPPLPADLPRPLKLAARTSHALLYVLILILPLSGWMMVSTSPRGGTINYFGLFDWPLIGPLAGLDAAAKKAWIGTFVETHETLAFVMIGLVLLHVSAALYHHFIRRDLGIWRMLPGD